MQTYKHLKLIVPTDYKVPDVYTNGTPSQRTLALTLGADAVVFFQKKAVERVRTETHEEAVKEAEKAFEKQLEEVQKSADQTTAKLALEKEKYEAAYKAAQVRLDALEATSAAIRQQCQKEARESMVGILEAKEEQIKRLQALLEKQVDTVCTRVEGLQNSITKTFSSSKEKGALGETLMESLLKKAFDCDIQVVSKESQTADIRMTRQSGACYFWEIKNYTRMVTTDEVEKFRRDLRLHPDVRGGCLVSLRTGIVGKTRGGDIDVEFLEDGRFILFMSHFMSREDPVFSLQEMRPFFDVVESMTKPVKDEGATIRALQVKANLIANLLRSHTQTVAKHKNSIMGHKKRIDTMFAEFQGFLYEEEAQLQTLLRVALGSDEEAAETQEEADTLLNSLVFKRGCLSDIGDDRARDFVKWLLGRVEVREGSQIEIKELVEMAKGSNYSEKFVKGLREDLFQESAWSKGARHILGLHKV